MRAAIYAHADVHGIVDDYVLHALRCFRKYFDVIVFVSCSTLSNEQRARADAIADLVVLTKKSMGVFHRWSNGFQVIAQHRCTEIFFIDDSFYGPCSDVVDLMRHAKLSTGDLWATVVSRQPSVHVRSAFMCFKTPLLQSGFAQQFWSSVSLAPAAEATTRQFEIQLTDRIHQRGYHLDAMLYSNDLAKSGCDRLTEDGGFREERIVKTNFDRNAESDPDSLIVDQMLRSRIPFIPTKIFSSGLHLAACVSILKQVRDSRRYHSRLITDHARRVYDFGEET